MQVSACKVGLGQGWGLYRQKGLQREGRVGEGRDEGTCSRFHLLNYTCRQVREGSRVLQQEKRVVRVNRTMSPVWQGGWVGAL